MATKAKDALPKDDCEREFWRGIGLGVAECQRQSDQAHLHGLALIGFGLSIKQYELAGLEEYDLKELRYCLEQTNGGEDLL